MKKAPLLVLAGLGMVVFGLYATWRTITIPSPDQLKDVAGTVTKTRALRDNEGVTGLEFSVSGDERSFNYQKSFPHFQYVQDKLIVGAPVRLRVAQVLAPEVWRLEIDGDCLGDVQAIHQARMQDARYMLYVTGAGVFLIIFGFCIIRMR